MVAEHRVPVTISLRPRQAAKLKELAERDHKGNQSAVVRSLLDSITVTKSAQVSPSETTPHA